MKFVGYFDALATAKKISVDGLVPNALCLTHWPGNSTPTAFKADTTTEIVARLLESGRFADVTRGYDVVTNNHFDTDGLLPSWLLLHPDADRALLPRFVAAARAGDFYWMDDEPAAQFNFLVEAFRDETVSPLRARFDGLAAHEIDQLCYDVLHAELPALFFDLDRCRDLWQPEWDRWRRHRDEIESARVTERPDRWFATIEGSKFYNRRAVHTRTRMDRVLMIVPYGDGWRYQFLYSKYSWYDVTKPCGKRRDFDALVRTLAAMERAAEGRWVNETLVEDQARHPERVYFGERPNVFFTSTIPPDRVIDAFWTHFA